MEKQKKHIVYYLIEKGFKPFRSVYENKKQELVLCKDPLNFSTMMNGYIDVRLIKDDSYWCFGLHEAGKPPTLIYPRTKELYFDDHMNRYLQDNDNDTIFAELYPLSIKK
jgi:hypothetical protein